MPLSSFHPVVQEWFTNRLGKPTDVQVASWPAIRSGKHALIAAPTGSGKTLAAFLTCIDSLLQQGLQCELEDHIQVVYVSPLKALSNDIQKNLQEPLAEITEGALSAGLLTPPLRVEVRTGDTPQHLRQKLLRQPPHILITTPESLFLLLTARKSRAILHNVRTVIVDEIHALAPNKRGSHLALSLERLEALCQRPPVRIGLSATQRPLDEIGRFLVGVREGDCQLIDVGHRRNMDLEIEVPNDELGAVATNAIWSDIYDRVAEFVRHHRSTLVFVNTRRLAERVAHHLAERLGEDQVASHHGSLSRKIRLSAEHRLKTGQLRVMVATASLELGIDIGHVELVCQIGSPRAISTCIQRVGRAGHWVGAIPKGRLFCTTRDELVECAAVVHAMGQGHLDPVTIPSEPIDILAQHLVAEVAGQEWSEPELFALCTRAYPYRDLKRQQFDQVIHMLAEGFVPQRRRQQAFLFHDRVHHHVRPRRGARLAALTSGGAIPDAATYSVIAEPDGTVVGTVDEDFAVESMAGDIILLGTSSWRIRGVEIGRIRVEDAHGAPPTIPFWRGEAPSRTPELSHEVALLREHLSQLLDEGSNGNDQTVQGWLQVHCGLKSAGADQVLAYLVAGKQVLGAVPTQDRIIAERFFDEAGGMQLVIHSPFGGRLNRAWGLALRKRFCLNFDFELQASATDDGLVISLGEKHSFPLDAIFSFLHSNSVREVLIQSLLGSPLFLTRWRWNASRALALLRFQKGKKVPLHIQRMRAEDLLTAAFPLATACQDNHIGDIPIPDHPLVQETVKDCLTEAMDIDGLTRLLQRMEAGQVQCLTVESPAPSPFSHEILNANPYAFLDDAPLEERRARAVNLRQSLSPDFNGELGALDPEAISYVVEEAWPTVRDSDELHDALHLLVWIPEEQGSAKRMGDE
jgi:ATP-dependent Lhr-like helicase